MKKLQLCFTLMLFLTCSGAWAGYACPDANNSGGGWSPAECSQTQTPTPPPQAPAVPSHTTAYACPPESNTSGGWMPLECMQRQPACADCGTVESVNKVQVENSGVIGTVAGAVAGGVLGNQVGKGKGRAAATVLGAVAGGVGGHYGEKLLRKKNRWDVIVEMQDSTHRTVAFDSDPGYKAGDKVKVSGDSLTRQ